MTISKNVLLGTLPLLLPLASSLASALPAATESTPHFLTLPAPAPLATTTATAPPPAAVPISTMKDWRLFDLGTSCVAETVATVNGVNHHLEVRVDKTNVNPVEVAIRSEVATSPNVGFKTQVTKTNVYSFAKLTGTGSDETFWNVPQGTEELLSFLKREMKLDAQAYDVTGAVPGATSLISFSLRGSSATLADLGKRCAAGLAVPTPVDASFEKAFLTASIDTQVSNLDFGRVTTAKADALRKLLIDARTAFLSSKALQSDIEKLNAKYLKEINELTGLKKNLDRLTQVEVTRLEQARTAAQAAIAQANQEIQTLKPQVAVKESELVTANTAYEAAYNNVKPLLPELNRLTANVSTQASALSDAQSRYSTADSRLNNANNALADLQNQSRNLRSRLSSEQNEAQSARSDFDRATRDANNFDAQSELRRRLQSDSRITNLTRELQDIDMRIRAQTSAVQTQENERNRLNGELVTCRRTPGRDCGPIQFQLTEANRRLQELQSGVQVLEGTRQQKQSEMAQVRGRIQNEVSQIENDLNRKVSDARARYNEADSRLRDTENRLRSIEQIDIPARQNDVSRFSNDRADAQRDINDYDRRLRQARTDLANYRQTSGFDSLQAEADRRLQAVNGLKAELQQIDRDIKRREKIVADNTAALAKISSDMEKVVAQIKAKESRSTEVQKALEPYEIAKADLSSKQALADQAFTAAQTGFSANL